MPYTDKKLSPSPGIYFEEVGKLNYYDTTWKVVNYINISVYEQTIAYLERSLQQTKVFCVINPVLFSYQRCNTTLKLVERRLYNTKMKETSIKDLLGHTEQVQRNRRGWFNGIGTMFKTLIGTLDEDDAEYYNKAINEVRNDEREVTKLLKEQTSVVMSTIKNFNNTISSLNKNELIFSENFKKLYNFSTHVTEDLNNFDLKRQADDRLSLLTLLSEEVENEVSTAMDAVLLAKGNVIHPILINPKTFIDELTITLPHLPSLLTYALPLKLENAHELMKISNIYVYYKKPNLICVISNPLIQAESLNLYNLIPAPTKDKNNTFFFIQPTAPFMGITEDRSQYTYLRDLADCKIIHNNYICHLREPVYNSYSRPICEVMLLTTQEGIPKSCDIRTIKIKNKIWKKLNTQNHWLYVSDKPTVITVSCIEQPPQEVILVNSGIFTLETNCKAFTKSTVLIPFSSTLTNFTVIVPPFNLIEDDCCIETSNKLNDIKLMHTRPLNINFNDLNLASHKLQDINRLSDDILSHKDISHGYSVMYYVSTTLFSIITLYATYRFMKFIYKIFCTCCQKQPNTENDTRGVINCNIFNICKETTEKTDKLSISSIEMFDRSKHPAIITNSPPTSTRRLRTSAKVRENSC